MKPVPLLFIAALVLLVAFAVLVLRSWLTEVWRTAAATFHETCQSCGKPATAEFGDAPVCFECLQKLLDAYDQIAAKVIELGLTPEQARTVMQKEEPWER